VTHGAHAAQALALREHLRCASDSLTLVVGWVEAVLADVGFHPSTLSSTYLNRRCVMPIEQRSKPNMNIAFVWVIGLVCFICLRSTKPKVVPKL
jgi:hypothetical protein